MEKQKTSSRSHFALILVGFLAIVISFLAYAKNSNLIITPAAMPALQNLAVATYLVLFSSFASIGWGLYKMYKTKISSADSTISSIIANAIHNKRSKQIFIISAIGYGLFFAFTSGTIIYKPDIIATDYGFPQPPHI
ncbi:MAG: hypothetical protein ACREA8_09400, partial [Nitrosotalea sp.]